MCPKIEVLIISFEKCLVVYSFSPGIWDLSSSYYNLKKWCYFEFRNTIQLIYLPGWKYLERLFIFHFFLSTLSWRRSCFHVRHSWKYSQDDRGCNHDDRQGTDSLYQMFLVVQLFWKGGKKAFYSLFFSIKYKVSKPISAVTGNLEGLLRKYFIHLLVNCSALKLSTYASLKW